MTAPPRGEMGSHLLDRDAPDEARSEAIPETDDDIACGAEGSRESSGNNLLAVQLINQTPTPMKSLKLYLLFGAVLGCACVQALVPELEPLATKYKADLATLETQRANAVAQAQTRYVAAL